MSVVLNYDWAEYRLGDYIIVNNVWGKYNVNPSPAYTQSITIDNPNDVSSGIHMSWNWQADPNNHAVLAYPEVSVGYKPWDDPSHGTGAINARIQNIKNFTVTHDLSIGGDTSRFNVAYDLWLTNKPLGDENTITTELMIWTHKGGPSNFGPEAYAGSYKQNDMVFDIVTYANFGDPSGETNNSWRYIALVPRNDILDETIDVRAVLYKLIDRGLVSGKDFVTGYELGAEVTGGAGSLNFDHISFDFDKFIANSQANNLVGSKGHDRIYGLGGADTIDGKAGNDFISGGTQRDRLTGGSGRDTFFFDDKSGKTDTIVDFVSGTDKIAFDSDVFTAIGDGQWKSAAFRNASSFDASDRIIYNVRNGGLYYDSDGSGTADGRHLIAVLENHSKLSYSDILVL